VTGTHRHGLLAWTAFAVAALGHAPLAKKLALDGTAQPLPLAVASAWIAGLGVVCWLALRGRLARLANLSRRGYAAILTVGALGSGAVPLLAVLAMTETTASNRALFQSAYPAATAIAARLLLGERLAKPTYALIGLVCVGLALVNVEFDAAGAALRWPFWALLATLPLIGLADVVAKRSLNTLSPEVVAAGRALGGALVLLLAVPLIDAGDWAGLYPVLFWVVLAGLSMAGFAIALYRVFERTQASIAASLIALAPLLTLVMERFMLDTVLGPIQLIGFATVLAAVVALSRHAQQRND
jgi:drug/metabolite transporter (DMT)-like permease